MSTHPNLTISAEVQERILASLLQVRNLAKSYLQGFDPEELRTILSAAEDELDIADILPDKGEDISFGFSAIDLLHSCADPGDEDVFSKVDEMTMAACQAYFLADDVIKTLGSDPPDINYLLAAEACSKAYKSLYTGLLENREGDYWRSDHAEKRAAKYMGQIEGGIARQRNRSIADETADHAEFVIAEFRKLCAHPKDVIIIKYSSHEKTYYAEDLNTPYAIRRKGKMNASVCATYIYDKYVELPRLKGREPQITWSRETIYETILKYIREGKDEKNFLIQGI